MDISNLTSLINALRAERMFLVAHKKETLLFSDVSFVRLGLLTKKRHCFSAMSLCSLGITHKKKTLLFSDVSFARLDCSQKKTLLFSDVSFGCPMGLEPMTFRTTI